MFEIRLKMHIDKSFINYNIENEHYLVDVIILTQTQPEAVSKKNKYKILN